MRQFKIDDLSKIELDSIEAYMGKSLTVGAMDGMYWLDIPDDLLAESQKEHADCAPFCFGFELTRDRLIVELLVRNRTNMHCSCIAYATSTQRDFVLVYLDKMIEELQIKA